MDDGIKSGGLGEQRDEICHFKTFCPPDQIVSAYVDKIISEIDFPELGLNCLLASYLLTCLLPEGRVKEMEIFDGICHEGGMVSRAINFFFQNVFFKNI